MWPDKAGFSPLLIYSAGVIDVVKTDYKGPKKGLNKAQSF
jgi:hypothetical protein